MDPCIRRADPDQLPGRSLTCPALAACPGQIRAPRALLSTRKRRYVVGCFDPSKSVTCVPSGHSSYTFTPRGSSSPYGRPAIPSSAPWTGPSLPHAPLSPHQAILDRVFQGVLSQIDSPAWATRMAPWHCFQVGARQVAGHPGIVIPALLCLCWQTVLAFRYGVLSTCRRGHQRP